MGALNTIVLLIIAFFISPLAVFLKVGCGTSFWINVILYILGVIPGIIHAFYIILTR